MKKMFFLGALFAVGLGFTACSSDNDEVAEATGQSENGGENYLALGINLPQAPASMTRAGENDNNGQVTYSDGLATEYAVKNATLIIFNDATNEDDATFVAAYTINTAPWTGGTSNNVTEMSTKVIKLVSSDVVAGYRAMVVLNHNNILTVGTDNGLTVNTTDLTAGTTTYATFRKMLTTSVSTLDAASMTSAGFFMANAPLSDASGSTNSFLSGNTTTLTTISADAIYKTEAEAQAATKFDHIFVERGVAKVTMESANGTMTNSKVAGTTPVDIKWTVSGWILDNTAPTTYLIRSTDGDSDFRNLKSQANTPATAKVYRYIGNTQINDGANTASGFWRTYFAKSAGYDKWAASETYSLNTFSGSGSDFTTNFGENYPKYCYENTFDVDHQNVKNTTLVQVAITAKQDGSTDAVDLYSLNGQKTTVYTADLLIAAIQEAAYYVMQGDGVTGSYGTADITVTLPTTSVAGPVELNKAGGTYIKVTPDATKITSGYVEDDFYTNLSAALGGIDCYKGGVSYYSIRIKHFGDNLTPWNTWEATQSLTAPTSSTIYPSNTTADARNGDYLGRYGVLRNNWYDITVNSVRSLGDATPHTGDWPDTPDDELDNYLAFRINVLSWAKRTQSADL
ncbi:MAG: Mfa1 fimbrilin C-terminal domain-containing protein [Prevotella sp.]|nr:Mfa1 fimbrilin C-terminal domain-containing protein [Prevotella sp.]